MPIILEDAVDYRTYKVRPHWDPLGREQYQAFGSQVITSRTIISATILLKR
jgi:hypothetical protein